MSYVITTTRCGGAPVSQPPGPPNFLLTSTDEYTSELT